jgi:hypothetical protein
MPPVPPPDPKDAAYKLFRAKMLDPVALDLLADDTNCPPRRIRLPIPSKIKKIMITNCCLDKEISLFELIQSEHIPLINESLKEKPRKVPKQVRELENLAKAYFRSLAMEILDASDEAHLQRLLTKHSNPYEDQHGDEIKLNRQKLWNYVRQAVDSSASIPTAPANMSQVTGELDSFTEKLVRDFEHNLLLKIENMLRNPQPALSRVT